MKKSNRSVAKIESITVRVTKIVALFTFICPLFVFAFVKQGEIDTEMGEGTGEVIQIEDQLLEIDVSGRHGRSSPRGTDYDNIGRASRNQQGRAGGNSPEPQEGTSGGQLELNFDVSEGVISIYGYAITSRGQANNALNFVLDVGTKIRAVFRGGNGGSGNRGGNGQQGGKGSDGTDATPSSSATSGGRGAKGGAAGCGSSGAHAGDGGLCSLGVPEEALELLLLVDTRGEEALGGTRGCHGTPGPGGPGGDGGSGCTWTERESYQTTETDSDGKTRTVTKTRTVIKSRPPAPDGPRGYTGDIPSRILRDGDDGVKGKVVYNVRRSDGTVTKHDERFLLKLQWYEIIDEHGDGILEPGDLVKVKNLTVANLGDIELPHNARIFVSVGDSEYTMTEHIELEVQNGMKPGESITFDQELEFRIKKNIMPDAAPEVFVVEDTILPRSFVTSQFVDAELDEFRSGIPIEIRYPIKIEQVTRLNTLSPGEATRFSFRIENLSKTRGFGEDSDLERAIAVWIEREGGDLEQDQLQFFTTEGTPVSIKDQLVEAVQKLGPGESAIFEGIVGMRADADLYRSGVIGVGLEMDTNEQDMHHIQHIPLNFSATGSYHSAIDSESKYLLIANQEMRQDTFQAWTGLVNSLGSELAIWDISYYSFLDLLAKLSDDGVGGETSLAKDFKGKTIIIPDHIFEYRPGEQNRATDFLRQIDLVKAQEMYGINFLVVSDRGETRPLFEELRTGYAENFSRHFKSSDELVENLDELQDQDVADFNYTQTVIRSFTKKRYFLGASKEKNLIRRAQKLAWELANSDPENEYTVVHRYDPRRLHRLGNLFGVDWFPTYSLGTLEIRRQASKPHGMGVHMNDEEFNINSAPFIYSQRLLTGLLMATPIDDRLNLLEDLIAENPDFENDEARKQRFDALMDSIQFDIANETQAALIQSWKGKPGLESLLNDLPILKAVANSGIRLQAKYEPQQPTEGQTEGEAFDYLKEDYVADRFLRLAAQLKAVADHNVPWYDNIVPGQSMNQRVKRVYSEQLGQFLQTSFGMEKQKWTWLGRLFDSRTEGESGFLDHDVNNRIADYVKAYRAGWRVDTTNEVFADVTPEEFRTPVMGSSPDVISGAEADERDQRARAREESVINEAEEMGQNRENLTVQHPGLAERLGIATLPEEAVSCVRVLNNN